MRLTKLHSLALSALAATCACLLSSCETTTSTVAHRSLPPYEPPLAKSDFQTVRTTAYTHTEADHLAYGARNALGGRLQSASIPRGRVEYVPRAEPVTDADDDDYRMIALTSKVKKAAVKTKKTQAKKGKSARRSKPQPATIGSAAADWSRWPVGTTFRILSTGQTYKVDDYGWALAGRNTIDLYMANRRAMNNWGVRHEQIQVIRWGDREQSLALLQSRQSFKHCRRMALQLQGLHEQAAALQ